MEMLRSVYEDCLMIRSSFFKWLKIFFKWKKSYDVKIKMKAQIKMNNGFFWLTWNCVTGVGS